jgi:hypothetical protein
MGMYRNYFQPKNNGSNDNMPQELRLKLQNNQNNKPDLTLTSMIHKTKVKSHWGYIQSEKEVQYKNSGW